MYTEKQWATSNVTSMSEDIKGQITKREIEILDLLSRGRSSNDIAEALFISKNTVNFHRRQLLRKTSSKNIAELIGKAYRLGILSK